MKSVNYTYWVEYVPFMPNGADAQLTYPAGIDAVPVWLFDKSNPTVSWIPIRYGGGANDAFNEEGLHVNRLFSTYPSAGNSFTESTSVMSLLDHLQFSNSNQVCDFVAGVQLTIYTGKANSSGLYTVSALSGDGVFFLCRKPNN